MKLKDLFFAPIPKISGIQHRGAVEVGLAAFVWLCGICLITSLVCAIITLTLLFLGAANEI